MTTSFELTKQHVQTLQFATIELHKKKPTSILEDEKKQID
jgi:hypothetical protein